MKDLRFTYTFICIQRKIDVWNSIKGNTAMLKRTEFRWDRLGSLDIAEQTHCSHVHWSKKSDMEHVSNLSGWLQSHTRKKKNKTSYGINKIRTVTWFEKFRYPINAKTTNQSFKFQRQNYNLVKDKWHYCSPTVCPNNLEITVTWRHMLLSHVSAFGANCNPDWANYLAHFIWCNLGKFCTWKV